jgi:hypothetical protein
LLSVHRYHEISESTHSILNPLSLERLALGTLDMMRAVAADDALAQNV